MNFKDKQYYINKAKEYLGLILSAIMFDVIVLIIVLG